MDILVLGGTRYFGVVLVNGLLKLGHNVTIATRLMKEDNFQDSVSRIKIDRYSVDSLKQAFMGKSYDVIYDNLAYCSNDVKHLLEHVKCKRYIMVSSLSIYELGMNITEEDFKPEKYELQWCERNDVLYGEGKRQAEAALVQEYSEIPSVFVRYPFVIGVNDYTKRLLFYIEHTIKGIPMYVDNIMEQLGFVSDVEAGQFLAFLAQSEYLGPINGCSKGTIAIQEILNYVEEKTGKKAILTSDGETGPYNEAESYSMNISKASELGYKFTDIKDWIFGLLDELIDMINVY